MQIEKAIQLFNSGKHSAASKICAKILKQEPANVQANVILFRIAEQSNNFKDYLRFVEKLRRFYPDNPDVQFEYGRALRLNGRPQEALEELRAVVANKNSYAGYYELGLAASDANNSHGARNAFEQALLINPGCTNTIKHLGYMAYHENRLDDAIELYGELVKRYPNTIHSYPELIKIHLLDANPSEALRLCDKCLQLEPSCTGVLAYKYVALCELGRAKEAEYLFDLENLIFVLPVECPEGFKSIEGFNSVLSNHILRHTQKSLDPRKYTTNNGWQTENGKLFERNKKLGKAMYGIIEQALSTYIARLPNDEGHPLLVGKPTQQHLESWAVVLTEQGHQGSHVHPKSWISGCYYVELPSDFDQQTSPGAGCIVFGKAEEGMHITNEP
ncbi:MAG: tetratricopeptide repeat protein, partial [Flavobacteriaceae bacterium]|nr:tetratricopeptide repeat protein [Flavobacteriaceae bacterium]